MRASIKTIGLLGTNFTIEQAFYAGSLREKHGLWVLIPPKADRDIVHRVIYQELVLGVVKESSRVAYLRIMDELCARGAEGVSKAVPRSSCSCSRRIRRSRSLIRRRSTRSKRSRGLWQRDNHPSYGSDRSGSGNSGCASRRVASRKEVMMKIKLNSVFVQDQARALQFYTEVLGFTKKMDLPAGAFRWLTVVSPDDPDGTQLVLEPNAHPAAGPYQRALLKSGIPLTAFAVDDIETEYRRLKALGVVFVQEPTDTGDALVAIFEDTCGNLIQIYQEA